jgi:hypothetical protein
MGVFVTLALVTTLFLPLTAAVAQTLVEAPGPHAPCRARCLLPPIVTLRSC